MIMGMMTMMEMCRFVNDVRPKNDKIREKIQAVYTSCLNFWIGESQSSDCMGI